ncbi:MAG: shikimate kinase [Planctomycetota bacterium]
MVLVGARASGKSTVGKELAWRLGWSFVDTDVGVAAVVGRAVGAFLAEHGEAAFRAVEAEVVDDALRHPNRAVVALGGGAVTIDAVASALRSLPVLVVWLEAPVAELVRRLRADPIQRPPLTDLPLEEEVRALLARRAARCEALAHIRLETFPANVDACCASLLATIQPLLTGS